MQRATGRHLVALLRSERRLLLRLAATSVAAAALPMAAILLIREFLAGVLGEPHGLAATLTGSFGRAESVWIVALLLLVTFLASAVAKYESEVVQQRLIRTLELGLMERLVRHILGLSVLFFDRQSHGDMLETVREDVAKVRLTVVSMAEMLLQGTLAAVPLMILSRRIRRRAYGLRRKGFVIFDVILQLVRGIRVIKVYRGEQAEAAHAIDTARRYFSEVIEMARTQALGRVALESFGGFSIVVVTIVGGFQVMHGTVTWPTLLTVLMAVRAAHGPLYELNRSYMQIQRNRASVQRIEQLLAERPELADAPAAQPFDPPLAGLSFERVSFAYHDGAMVLRDVSFEVRAGEVLGIVGPSGAGKTTLLNLVARFVDPSSGLVTFNGQDGRVYRVSDLYGLMAIVTQEPFLFSTTVRENIRCGRPDASDGEVEAAARAAEIHDEIVTLPQGYDTLVGIGQRGLSGGQVQRLNVARAILKNAPLLILDEATSSLDSIAEAKVQRAITRLMSGRTTFIVAHRLSTLRNATRILMLDRGRVIGFGTHDALVLGCPLYRRMWETQQMTERLDTQRAAGPLARLEARA